MLTMDSTRTLPPERALEISRSSMSGGWFTINENKSVHESSLVDGAIAENDRSTDLFYADHRELDYHVKKSPRRMQQCSNCGKLSGIGSSLHKDEDRTARPGQNTHATGNRAFVQQRFAFITRSHPLRSLSLHSLSDCRSLFPDGQGYLHKLWHRPFYN